MPSTAYRDIVQRLDTLESQEFLELIAEIRTRMANRPKRNLKEFLAERQDIKSSNEDWLTPLREEWNREF